MYSKKELLNKIKDKFIIHSIFRIQTDDSVMCIFYCTAFIVYMIAGKTLLDYTDLCSPNNYKKKVKTIYKHFKEKYGKPSF